MRLGVPLANLSVYADDISITMYEQPSRELISAIIAAIESSGNFRVNRKKVRTNSCKYAPHEITGIKIFVDKDGLIRSTIPQKKRNELRGMIHRAAKIIEGGREPTKKRDGFTSEVIAGHVAWLNMVYPGKMPSGLSSAIKLFKTALKNS
jgi:hypothetical protein